MSAPVSHPFPAPVTKTRTVAASASGKLPDAKRFPGLAAVSTRVPEDSGSPSDHPTSSALPAALSNESTKILALAYRNASPEERTEIRNQIMLGNQRLLHTWVARLKPFNCPFDLALSEGQMELLDTIDHFDPDNGCGFGSYFIQIRLKKLMGRLRLRYQFPNLQLSDDLGLRLLRVRAHYFGAGEAREPSNEEIAAGMNLSAKKIAIVRPFLKPPVALDDDTAGDPGEVVGDSTIAAPDESCTEADEETARTDMLNLALASLKPKEREIMQAMFGLNGQEPLPEAELARRYNRTRQWVNLQKQNALDRMRAALKERQKKQAVISGNAQALHRMNKDLES
jgi:RNA polymerase nonessential primary-like sigma factor